MIPVLGVVQILWEALWAIAIFALLTTSVVFYLCQGVRAIAVKVVSWMRGLDSYQLTLSLIRRSNIMITLVVLIVILLVVIALLLWDSRRQLYGCHEQLRACRQQISDNQQGITNTYQEGKRIWNLIRDAIEEDNKDFRGL